MFKINVILHFVFISLFRVEFCFTLGNSTILQEYTKNKLTPDVRVEENSAGMTSLAFVFDTTGSMHVVLDTVKRGASMILQTVLRTKKQFIYNFIFSPFNDPRIGPLTVTTDPEVYKQALENVTVGGGGDCAEMMFHGLKEALQTCLPNSYIYVFSNSDAKDLELLDTLILLIQKKSAQVIFILTGYCETQINAEVYTKIAAASSGQVFYLSEWNVDEMMTMIEKGLKANKVNLISVDSHSPTTYPQSYTIPVDNSLNSMMISLSGKNSSINITNPSGYNADIFANVRSLVNLDSIKIIDIENPEPGIWEIHVTSSSEHSLRASGSSHINFEYGFSILITRLFNETNRQPVRGCRNFLLIKPSNNEYIWKLTTVEIITLDGCIRQILSLYCFDLFSIPSLNISCSIYGTSLVPEDDYFYLKVNGITKDGFPICRITKTPVTSVSIDKIVTHEEIFIVDVRPSHLYYKRGENISVICSIITNAFGIQFYWKKDGRFIEDCAKYSIVKQNGSLSSILISNAVLSDEGVYECEASSNTSAGSVSASTHVYYTEVPFIKAEYQDISTEVNCTVTLQCDASGYPMPQIRWYHETQLISNEFYRDLAKYEILDEILIIHGTSNSDAGHYYCYATNVVGESFASIYLHVVLPIFTTSEIHQTTEISSLRKPRINNDQTVYETELYTELQLECKTTGNPKPQITWMESGIILHSSGVIYIDEEENILNIRNVTNCCKYEYTCIATNIAGTANVTFTIHVLVKSRIRSNYTILNITLEEGDDYGITCLAMGQPEPVIRWLFNSRSIVDSDKYVNEKMVIIDNNTLVIINVGYSEAGMYTCEARNKISTDVILYAISVVPRFDYLTEPDIIPIKVEELSTTVMRCYNGTNGTHWLKDGVPLDMGNNERADEAHYVLSHDGKSLKIVDVRQSDGGLYLCMVPSKQAAVKHKYQLFVLRSPLFEEDQYLNHIDIVANSEIIFNCIADGFPKPKVDWKRLTPRIWPINRWTFPDAVIQNPLKQMLKIKYANIAHGGTYKCTAKNEISAITKYFIVNITKTIS